ncbi:nucleotide-binding universal stress UspA family protein [Isoptericola sp. CG 20/1183]|uniref:Nucleotide-binding universal stress UspA family protein n=1 Tax=Isoptericola halotolerans TaxID=300560 RepID=A0ABX5EA80_9MICO|nr:MULTISPECIES: universal stress protein [Isoptericola]PRZ03068.1 nucleotide-binding universal stress UspA family protein [Isoptericola sp. CG 20/1183]PRZ03322.1 nucleotide-binding universal stress UspA family protein [Isoptericola halotolerans]
MSTTRYGVVAGIDGSSAGDQALEWAAAEAVRRRTCLTVVTAYEVTATPSADGYGLGPAALRAEAQDVTDRALRRLAEKRRLRPGSVPDDIDAQVVEGAPAGVLVERSAVADLVVVGRRGRHALDRLVLGSVSSAVSAMARGPVAVVPIDPVALQSACPADAVGPVWRVVAAVDFDDHLNRVLDLAFDEARHAGAPLAAVHALTRDLVAGPYAAAGGWVHQYQDEALASVHDEMRRWGEKYPGVQWSVELGHGSCVDVLVSRLSRHDLVVVGGRRHTPLTGRVLRSVADRLTRDVPCPVIVAHG